MEKASNKSYITKITPSDYTQRAQARGTDHLARSATMVGVFDTKHKEARQLQKGFKEYNNNLVDRSRLLRKNMTAQEKKLWYQFLRKHALTFYRQRIIYNYIVDFYCPVAKLVVEIDGSQHYTEDGLEYDEMRSEKLEEYGLKVLRYTNQDIDRRFEAVCQSIDLYISSRFQFRDSKVL